MQEAEGAVGGERAEVEHLLGDVQALEGVGGVGLQREGAGGEGVAALLDGHHAAHDALPAVTAAADRETFAAAGAVEAVADAVVACGQVLGNGEADGWR